MRTKETNYGSETNEDPWKSKRSQNRIKTLEICHKCGRQMDSWDKRLTKTFKVYNTCERCFCRIYDMDQEAFRAQMENFFGMRPCQGI